MSLTATRRVTRQPEARRAAPSVGRPGVVWALPGLIFFAAFAVLPMGGVAYLSLTDWDGLSSPRFVGLENWARFTTDPQIMQSIWLTLVLLAGNVAVQMPVSILLGVWAAGPQRNRAILSAVFFLPLLLSTAATAIMWRQLLDPNFGVPAQLAAVFGGDGNFVGSPRGAMIALVIVTSWQFVPFHSLLFQGAARAVPATLYQAAMIDGAGRVRQFFAITLPQLRNTVVTSGTLMVVGGLTAFDVVLVLTNGGPGTDTTILPFRMYREAFQTYNYGYGSAIALLLLIVATAVSLLLVRLSGYDKMQSTQEGL